MHVMVVSYTDIIPRCAFSLNYFVNNDEQNAASRTGTYLSIHVDAPEGLPFTNTCPAEC